MTQPTARVGREAIGEYGINAGAKPLKQTTQTSKAAHVANDWHFRSLSWQRLRLLWHWQPVPFAPGLAVNWHALRRVTV
jgi:hypothetical protein